MEYYVPADFDRIFNNISYTKKPMFDKWFSSNIKPGDIIKFTYMSNIEKLFDEHLIDLGQNIYKFKAGRKTFFFKKVVLDYFAVRDCDVRISFICMDRNKIKKQFLKTLEQLNEL